MSYLTNQAHIDVSSVKVRAASGLVLVMLNLTSKQELCKRWRPDLRVPKGESSHRCVHPVLRFYAVDKIQWQRVG